MNSFLDFIQSYYTLYTMLLVVGSGLMSYFVDYKNMKKEENKKEAKISKFLGLTYIIGGILLYILVIFTG